MSHHQPILVLTLVPLTEDELQNVEMAEEERRKKNQDLKIKKRDYTGYDDEEFTPDGQGLMKRAVLAKYDEDIEGTRETVCSVFRDMFRLADALMYRRISG